MPRLGLEPRGYRNVRGTVVRRVARRIAALGLAGPSAYHAYLEAHEGEWSKLDAMCRIPISRLYRDADTFARIERELLPARAAAAHREGRDAVRVWSAGCASGEEPTSVALAWAGGAASRPPEVRLEVVATDADADALERAKRGVYTESSLAELPAHLRALPREPVSRCITYVVEDLRADTPRGPFDLVLCRNVAFTYFDEATQRGVADRLVQALAPGGFLVVGKGERLPEGVRGVALRAPLVYERT